MNKFFLVLVALLIICPAAFPLSCLFPGYTVDNEGITFVGYSDKVDVKADLETFQALDNFFAKDANHIYYQGKILEHIDAKTFEAVERNVPKQHPVWGDGCGTRHIIKFKDKNGEYTLEDINNTSRE